MYKHERKLRFCILCDKRIRNDRRFAAYFQLKTIQGWVHTGCLWKGIRKK